MKKIKLVWIIGIIIVALISGFLASIAYTYDEKQDGAYQGWQTYINKEYEFSMKYPPEFVFKEDPDGAALVAFSPKNGAAEGNTAKVYDESEFYTAESVAELKALLDKKWSDHGSVAISIEKIGGFDAVIIQNIPGYLSGGYLMYVLTDDNTILSFNGQKDSFDEQMFKSIKKI